MKFFQILNKYCLFFLVFSITFENWDPFKLVGSYSVTYLTSILYIGTWIPMIKRNFSLLIYKKYVVPLLFFILIGFISTAFNTIVLEEFKQSYNYRVLLLVFLMMLMASHISSERYLIVKVLNTYVASMILVFILFSFGIGESYEKGRLMLFGENPNLLGMKAVIAFLIVAAKALDQKFSIKRVFVSLALCIPLVSLVLLTASRGAFLSIFIGFSILIFFQKISVFKKTIIIVFGGFSSIFFFSYAMLSNPELQRRLMHSIEQGDIGRNDLWVGALEAINNNLFIGVGFTGVLSEMLRYSGRYIDPHNVFLYVLMSSGILGFIFFMKFIRNVIISQYLTYKITGKTMYLVILLIMLFNMSKAGGGIGKILFWFLFAILIAAGNEVVKVKEKDLIK